MGFSTTLKFATQLYPFPLFGRLKKRKGCDKSNFAISNDRPLVTPRLSLASSASLRLQVSEPLSYVTISLFITSIHPFYVFEILKINSLFRCKANVFGVCV